MGLMLLFKLLVTLIYPLYASIRSIESSSVNGRRWLMYWILLILFELTIEHFNDWLPHLPYDELITAFSLIFLHSDAIGTYAASLWLSMVRIFVHRLKLQYGELVSDKQDGRPEKKTQSESRHTEHAGARTDGAAVVVTDEVRHTETSLRSNSETTYRDAVLPESPDPNKSKKEWTCDVCEVATTSKTNLKDHLNGKKHKAKEKENRSKTTMIKYHNAVSDKETGGQGELKSKVLGYKATPASGACEAAVAVGRERGLLADSSELKKSQKEWTCARCQVATTCEADLQNHLLGKRHKENESKQERNKNRTENQKWYIQRKWS